MKDFRFRGPLALVLIVAMQMLLAACAFTQLIGGTPVDSDDGSFVLHDHAEHTPVTRRTWQAAAIVDACQQVSALTCFAVVVACLVAHRRRWNWYANAQDYGAVVVIVVMVGLGIVILADFLKPQ